MPRISCHITLAQEKRAGKSELLMGLVATQREGEFPPWQTF